MSNPTPRAFQACAIAKALRLYSATGMQVNRAYTPRAMMKTAEAITGRKFAPRAYDKAADALAYHVENHL